jgi:KaiC/GvpD/RAD55 family RecA-like ATPase/5S rRNA maturation endonuclease (ribonuclease M5)
LSDIIKTFLDKGNYNFKLVGDNYQISCPLCTDSRFRLGIHKESGRWSCFNCRSGSNSDNPEYNMKNLAKAITKHTGSGGLNFAKKSVSERKAEKRISIKKDIGDVCAKRLWKGGKRANKALKYLRDERGYSDETIKHFNIGIKRKFKSTKGNEYIPSSVGYLSIPITEAGELTNIKYRVAQHKKPKDCKEKWLREAGGKSSLFHDEVIDDYSYNEIFIAEAEMDAMSMYEAGIKNVVALTVGAKSFKQFWRDRLARFDKIYICLDTDEDGQAGARKLAQELGMGRCYNIVLPDEYKDLNDYFYNRTKKQVENTKEDFLELTKGATRFNVDELISSNTMFKIVADNILNEDEDGVGGVITSWNTINTRLGSSKPGHFVVVAGRPKVGKTTYCINWMLDLARDHEVPSLYYSCEMNEDSMGRTLIRMTEPTYTDMDDITVEQAKKASMRLPKDLMKFCYPKLGELNLDLIIQNITNSVQRYGTKIVFFDNLLFLARGIKDEDGFDHVGKITQTFKSLAETLGIVFVLVTHPRKTNTNRQLHPDELKDSSSVFQDLDSLVLLHRSYSDEDDDDDDDGGADKVMSATMEVRIVGRYCTGGDCFLYFDGFTGRIFGTGQKYQAMLDERRSKDKKKKLRS